MPRKIKVPTRVGDGVHKHDDSQFLLGPVENSVGGGVQEPSGIHSTNGPSPTETNAEGGSKHAVNAKVDMARPSAPDVPALCKALQDLQVSRRFLIASRIRQTNACGAMIRVAFGFTGALDESERAKIKKRSASIVSAYFAGKPLAGEDAEIVEAFAVDLDAVAQALKPMLAREAAVVKEMEALAKRLPAYSWVEGVRGFGARALAVLIGETGDLFNYPNFRMVWKRLGLAPFDGLAASNWKRSDRRPRALAAEEWINLGYKPGRRAEMHALIADPMSKHQLESAEKSGTEFGASRGLYGKVYVARREQSALAHPDWTKGHARDDALRIMTKKLISDLWSEWRGSSPILEAKMPVAPAELLAE